MEQHLLLSTIVEGIVFLNDQILQIAKRFGLKTISAFSFSNYFLYKVDLERLLVKLDVLENIFKDQNLKVKSNFCDSIFGQLFIFIKLNGIILKSI